MKRTTATTSDLLKEERPEWMHRLLDAESDPALFQNEMPLHQLARTLQQMVIKRGEKKPAKTKPSRS